MCTACFQVFVSPCQENLISLQQPLSLARTGFLRSAEMEGKDQTEEARSQVVGDFFSIQVQRIFPCRAAAAGSAFQNKSHTPNGGAQITWE